MSSINTYLMLLQCLHRRVAEVEGIDLLYIERRLGGQRANTVNDDQLARFAAAVLLDWVVQDVNQSQQLVQAWGKPQTLTKAGNGWCAPTLVVHGLCGVQGHSQ